MRAFTIDLSGNNWRKSNRSTNGGNCAEVAIVRNDGIVAPHKPHADTLYVIRDSKDPNGPVIALDPAEWRAFVDGIKDGDFADDNLPRGFAVPSIPA